MTWCPYCARERTTSGDYIGPTCGRSECQQADTQALFLFNSLGKRGKVAIALRDEPFFSQYLKDQDRVVREGLIARCERYTRDLKRLRKKAGR